MEDSPIVMLFSASHLRKKTLHSFALFCTLMLIRLGYDIQFETVGEVPIVTLLNGHPSRKKDLREPDELPTDPLVKVETYEDTFGNHSCRLLPPPGKIRLQNSTLIEDSGELDLEGLDAAEV